MYWPPLCRYQAQVSWEGWGTPPASSSSDTHLTELCHPTTSSLGHIEVPWPSADTKQWGKRGKHRTASLSSICKETSRATSGTSPRCHGEDVLWDTLGKTLQAHGYDVVAANLHMEQPLPLTQAPGSSPTFTTCLLVRGSVPALMH